MRIKSNIYRCIRRMIPLAIFSMFMLLVTGLQVSSAQPANNNNKLLYSRIKWDNGLAKTPPMGWNSWNHFGCNISEDIIKQTADAMVSSGLKDAGYEYIVIDDCWMDTTRDAQGRLQNNPTRFSHGIKWLADYVHSKGLKLGIYSSAGTKTCQGLPASLDHEKTDAKTFASWGIDYLKLDNCYNQGRPLAPRYTAMHNALEAAGRPIVFSICEWGVGNPWEWAPPLGNLWRTTGDISDNWNSMVNIVDQQVGLNKYAGPGHWNDPDMLEVGNGGMTDTEYKAHFSLWCILAAPLMAGNDLRNMSPDSKEILTNKEVIAVDQDPAGKEGYKISDNGDQEVWVKPMSDGSYAVLFFNRGTDRAFMTTSAEQVGLSKADTYKVVNLWIPENSSRRYFRGGPRTYTTENLIRGYVQPHGVTMFRVWPQK